jgi:hypothetical protein
MDLDRLSVFPAAIKRVPDGTLILGTPVGTDAFCEAALAERVDHACHLMEFLPELDDHQVALLLLRSCLGSPRLVYACRTCSSQLIIGMLQRFDKAVRRSLALICGRTLSAPQQQQASWPIRRGGLGLRSVLRHADAAFLASFVCSLPLQNAILGVSDHLTLPHPFLDDALEGYNGLLPADVEPYTIDALREAASPLQRSLSSHLDDSSVVLWTAAASSDDRVRLSGCSSPFVNAFLTAVPIPELGFSLPSDAFAATVRVRLGVEQYAHLPVGTLCQQCGRRPLDSLGHHAFACGNNDDRVQRHNHLRDVIAKLMAQARLAPVKEAAHLLPDLPQQRPGDIWVPKWKDDRPAAFDITVVSPFAIARPVQEFTPGYAASRAAAAKLRKSHALCHAAGIDFIPLAFECTGFPDSRSSAVLRRVAQLAVAHAGPARSAGHLFADFRRRVSFSIQRSLARCILRRDPFDPADPIPFGG